jgi:hypothetical protein
MSIAYPASLKAVGGARTGITPVNLLDVLDVNGNLYFFSDRPISAPNVLTASVDTLATGGVGLTPPVILGPGQAVVWSWPGTVSGDGLWGGQVSPGSCSGHIDMEYAGPFTNPNDLDFSNFSVPALPAGAVVDAAYIVVNHGPKPDEAFTSNFGISDGPGQDYSETPFSGLAGVNVGFRLWRTLGGTPNGLDSQQFNVYNVGIAVYYHIAGNAGGGGGGSYNPGAGANAAGYGPYLPWILSVPEFSFHRSLQTDVGNFVLQNLSGDTLSRDFEKIMRRSALEGAMFAYRLWQPDALASWIEVHGTLTVDDVGVDTVTLKGMNLINPAQDDTPAEQYCETCQIQWGGRRCGATGATECMYSYQSCQVPERIMVVLNDYEKNYGEATANVPTKTINRRRKF